MELRRCAQCRASTRGYFIGAKLPRCASPCCPVCQGRDKELKHRLPVGPLLRAHRRLAENILERLKERRTSKDDWRRCSRATAGVGGGEGLGTTGRADAKSGRLSKERAPWQCSIQAEVSAGAAVESHGDEKLLNESMDFSSKSSGGAGKEHPPASDGPDCK